MTFLQEITGRFPIRKTAEQKEAFLKYALAAARKMGYEARIEENGRHRNWIAGDPETAEIIFTAHYDTPAVKPLPNLIIPRNVPLFLLYHFCVVLLLFAVSFGAAYLLFLLTREKRLTLIAFILAYYALLMLITVGPANKNNVNCNTSGVAAVMQLMLRIPEEARGQAAFILFDNGEKGRLGSRAYATRHQQIKKRSPVFNMDCVGVGDHLLIGVKNFARATFAYGFVQTAFTQRDGVTPHFYPNSGCILHSDHQSFRCGITATACRRRRLIGFYTPDIQTRRDTKADQANIDYLTDTLTEVVKTMAEN